MNAAEAGATGTGFRGSFKGLCLAQGCSRVLPSAYS